jgi:hypothetical protein
MIPSFRSLILLVATVACAAPSVACSSSAKLTPPPGFAEIEAKKEPYVYRATTARGVVVAARVEKNEPRGNLDFWAEAVDLRVRNDGFQGEAPKNVTGATGIPGKLLRYSKTENGRTVRYFVTVYTTEKRVYVVEAAGDSERFDPLVAEVERAELSLRPD